MHPASGFNVFDPKNNIYDVDTKPAVGMGKVQAADAGGGGGMSAAMANYFADDTVATIDRAEGAIKASQPQGVGNIDSLMKIAGARPVEQIGVPRGAPGGMGGGREGGGVARPAS